MNTVIAEELRALGVECETVGDKFVVVRFDAVRWCPDHGGHFFDSLGLVLEGDHRAEIRPYLGGGVTAPDHVLESNNNDLVGEVVSMILPNHQS